MSSEHRSNLKQKIVIVRKLLQELAENANPRRGLTDEETKRIAKLESIADKLKRGENVQSKW